MTATTTDNLIESNVNSSGALPEKTKKPNEPMAAVKQQLTDFGSQFQEYLKNVDAKIDGYKFSLEKHKEGLTVDFSIRATMRPKDVKKTAEKVV